jgi:hypothetical protein
MAKFHNYSFNNTLLIAMQGGQLVAGFNKWKDTFHRTVKKGEKAGRTGQADSGQGRQAADRGKNGTDSGVQGGVRVRCQPDRGRTSALYRGE